MGRNPGARWRPDSYQIIGLLVIGGVLAGVAGFSLERFDVVVIIAVAVSVVLGFVGRNDRAFADGGGTGGDFFCGDGCGDGGDGGGD